MSRGPHVVVVHRWQDQYAKYESYVDHSSHTVTYVTTEFGVVGVPAGAADVTRVDATDDVLDVRRAVKLLAEKHGDPATIIALKEDDLLIAAQLRAEWGIRLGPTARDLLPFRDKLVMSTTVAAAGIDLPAFAAVDGVETVRAFAEEHGWPVIVKPRLGSASVGVVKVDSAAALDAVTLDDDEMMVQSFDSGQIYHVDGVFDGERLGPWRASRYQNTCLGFRHGDVLGSVEVDDPKVNAVIGEFATQVLRAMAGFATAFHLEVFVSASGSGEIACRFLEIGARVGGAEIAFLWREVHGYDLMEASFRLGLGEPLMRYASPAEREIAGWLLAPAPTERPCRIVEATSMLGLPDGPYAEVILAPGDVLPSADAYYEHVGGRFRFRGRTSAEVEAKVAVTADRFEVCGVRVARESTARALEQ